MKFSYTASDAEGKRHKGVVDALTMRDAITDVRGKGLLVIDIRPNNTKPSFLTRIRRKSVRVSVLEQALLSRHLALMLEAGVPVDRAIAILVEQANKSFMKDILNDVLESIRRGETLTSALSRHPNVFSQRYVAMVSWGEQAGALSKSLNHLASQLEHDYKILSNVRGALLYPSVIIGAIVIVGLIMAVFVMPQLVSVVESFEVELPLMTRIFIGVIEFLTGSILTILLLLLAGVLGCILLLRKKTVRRAVSGLLLRIPAIGSFITHVNLARFDRAFGSLLDSGIPVVDALFIIRDGSANAQYRDAVTHMAEDVREGKAVSDSMQRFPLLFPPIQIHMIEVGSESGNLVTVLAYMADFYEERVNALTENLTKLIEPILLIVVGVVVGIIVLAVLMPIYQLSEGIV